MRTESKNWEKKLTSIQKERMTEINNAKRALKEKQDHYAGLDSYILRSGGLTSSSSTLSMEFEKVGVR